MVDMQIVGETSESVTVVFADTPPSDAGEIVKRFLRDVDDDQLMGAALSVSPHHAGRGVIEVLMALANNWDGKLDE